MVVSTLSHDFLCKINMEYGFNMSLIDHPIYEGYYLATIRKQEKLSDTEYPTIKNCNFLLVLNQQYDVVEINPMNETLIQPRKLFTSFTVGLEDCRLINCQTFTAVTLDNNENWIPEVCLCKYDYSNGNIEMIQVLKDEEYKPQKNWLFLNENISMMYFIHSYNPMKIISIDKHSFEQRTIYFQKAFYFDGCEMHGGACIYLEDLKKYLINVRVIENHVYGFSLWILLNEKYKLLGTSQPFTFLSRSDNSSNNYYEMCMSLLKKNDILLCSISVCDKDVYIIEYNLQYILNGIAMHDILQL